MVLIGNITSAAHAANHITITVKGANGSTNVCTRTTNSSGGSAITAGAVDVLDVDNNEQATYAITEKVHVSVVQASSGTANDFTLLFVFEPARLNA